MLDILTQNPEVWKKTIFILCYDENDGYYDHVPPFVPPFPDRPETGKVSAGIDPARTCFSRTRSGHAKGKPEMVGQARPDRTGVSRAVGDCVALEPRRLRLLGSV